MTQTCEPTHVTLTPSRRRASEALPVLISVPKLAGGSSRARVLGRVASPAASRSPSRGLWLCS